MAGRGRIEDVIGTRFDFVEPDETPLSRFRPSLRLLAAEVLRQVAVLGLVILVAVVLLTIAQQEASLAAQIAGRELLASILGINLIFFAAQVARVAIQTYFTEYVITDKRTYAVNAFISRKLEVVPYEKVTNLAIRRNLFQRLINVDSVHLVAYGDAGVNVRMRGVTDTGRVFESLQRLTRAQCTAENLLEQD